MPNLAQRFGEDEGPPTQATPSAAPPASPSRRDLPSTRDLTTGETTATEGLPGYTEELSVELSVSQELSLELDPETTHKPRPIPEAPPPTEDVPKLSRALPFTPPLVRPAEVWVLQDNAWKSGGNLLPGRKATARGGWVRLDNDGKLTVVAGPDLSGSSTLADGRSVDIATGTRQHRLPPGSSVLLRSGQHGIYVRSEPLGSSRTSGPRPTQAPRPR